MPHSVIGCRCIPVKLPLCYTYSKNTICSWRERVPCLLRSEKPHLRSGKKKCVETYFAKLNLVNFLLRLWAFVGVKLLSCYEIRSH